MVLIGVTGGIGSGKTTVSKMFEQLGAYGIDADKIVHCLLESSVRQRLGRLVFDDKKALKKLCTLIHPLVKKKIRSVIKKNSSQKAIVIDAPLLIESRFHNECDYLIVVKAAVKKQLSRASEKLSLSENEVKKRMRMQMPLKEKAALADFVINNNGSLENTQSQVRKIWEKIMVNKKGEKWKK